MKEERTAKISPSMFDSKKEFETVDIQLFKNGKLSAGINCISKREAKQIKSNHEKGIE